MQEVARILATEMTGVESRIVDLSAVIGRAGGPGRLAFGWSWLRRELRSARVSTLITHAPNSALFASAAAACSGVGQRMLVVHAGSQTLGSRRVAAIQLMTSSGLINELVFVGHSLRASYPTEVEGRARVTVIQNGVRLPEGRAEQAPSAQSGFTAVCTGRLVPTKNVGLAVEALARCRTDARLAVFGEGPERSGLEARASEAVCFRGEVARHVLRREYAKAQALLFPSVSEGLPLALIEAAAAGLPVVAGDLDFNREVMGDAALYAPIDSPDAWAVAIDRLASDPGMRERLAVEGRRRSELFTVARMVGQYERLVATGGTRGRRRRRQ